MTTPVAWWIPKAEQFCLAKADGSRPFAKAWEPLYAAPPQVAIDAHETLRKLDSHGLYWVENRGRIIDAIAAAGFQITSNKDSCWLEPLP